MARDEHTPNKPAKHGLKLSRFINTQGHVMTLDQLRAREPAAWSHAGLRKLEQESGE